VCVCVCGVAGAFSKRGARARGARGSNNILLCAWRGQHTAEEQGSQAIIGCMETIVMNSLQSILGSPFLKHGSQEAKICCWPFRLVLSPGRPLCMYVAISPLKILYHNVRDRLLADFRCSEPSVPQELCPAPVLPELDKVLEERRVRNIENPLEAIPHSSRRGHRRRRSGVQQQQPVHAGHPAVLSAQSHRRDIRR
jgi:hypothetical protein